MRRRARALTDRNTTHRRVSFVSDPSELGSGPDSLLESRYLRARMKFQIVGVCVRARLGQLRKGQAETSRQQMKTTRTPRGRVDGAACQGTNG